MRRPSFVFTCAACVAVTLVAGVTQANPYVELVPFDTIVGDMGSTYVYSHAFDGHTAYFQVRGGDAPGITEVSSRLDGVQVQSVLLSPASWIAQAGSTSMTTFYGFGRYGSYLQFAETTSDSIWRVDTGTGALTQYVTKAQIQAHTGTIDDPLLTSPSTIDAMGEHVFYDSRSDSILRTTGLGTLETLVSSADLTLAFSNDTVSGGMSFDVAGSLYWGNTASDEIHRRTAAGDLEVVLSEAVLEDFTGATSSSFNDVFVAPDGMIYFWEGGSDSILRFDPADPAGTLAYRLTEEELVDGPAGSDSVSTLGWYNGQLTWTKITGGSGLYMTPEPTTIVLLAGGLLAVALRRRAR